MSAIVTIIGVVDGAGQSAPPPPHANSGPYPDLPLQIFSDSSLHFFLAPYNRISHWREKPTVWFWGGPSSCVCVV